MNPHDVTTNGFLSHFGFNTLREAIAETAACMPVYRTYVVDKASGDDRRFVDWAIAQARQRSRSGLATPGRRTVTPPSSPALTVARPMRSPPVAPHPGRPHPAQPLSRPACHRMS